MSNLPPNDNKKSSFQDFVSIYNIFRDYIKQEDYLAISRLSAMLSIHGFLYASYGFTIQKQLEISEKISEFYGIYAISDPGKIACFFSNEVLLKSFSQNREFSLSIAAVGTAISVVSLVSILAAMSSAKNIRSLINKQFKDRKQRRFSIRSTFEVEAEEESFIFPPIVASGSHLVEILGRLSSVVMPAILIASWILAFIYSQGIEIESFRNNLPNDHVQCKITQKQNQR